MNGLSRIAIAVCGLAACAAWFPVPSGADQRAASPALLPREGLPRIRIPAARPLKHNIFGTIVSLGTTKFVLRTRRGRSISVDATPAIDAGSYSAPLFVGKMVLVGGTVDASGVVHATSVTRMTRIDASTAGDS